jgi:hypothetical protein
MDVSVTMFCVDACFGSVWLCMQYGCKGYSVFVFEKLDVSDVYLLLFVQICKSNNIMKGILNQHVVPFCVRIYTLV